MTLPVSKKSGAPLRWLRKLACVGKIVVKVAFFFSARVDQLVKIDQFEFENIATTELSLSESYALPSAWHHPQIRVSIAPPPVNANSFSKRWN